MRIVIESNEHEGVVGSVPGSTASASAETTSGAAPSERLAQAVAAGSSVPTETMAAREGIDGGPPPQWLMEAIQNATSSSQTGATSGSDAGAAPTESHQYHR
jgi:hypothetical protein